MTSKSGFPKSRVPSVKIAAMYPQGVTPSKIVREITARAAHPPVLTVAGRFVSAFAAGPAKAASALQSASLQDAHLLQHEASPSLPQTRRGWLEIDRRTWPQAKYSKRRLAIRANFSSLPESRLAKSPKASQSVCASMNRKSFFQRGARLPWEGAFSGLPPFAPQLSCVCVGGGGVVHCLRMFYAGSCGCFAEMLANIISGKSGEVKKNDEKGLLE